MPREEKEADVLEEARTVARLAAEAGASAYRKALKEGRSVTVAENGWIVRHHPDGSRERLRPLQGSVATDR